MAVANPNKPTLPVELQKSAQKIKDEIDSLSHLYGGYVQPAHEALSKFVDEVSDYMDRVKKGVADDNGVWMPIDTTKI